jgi:regulator of CtrA degradation
MHVLAWLLNQRAYFAGELTEFQLRRHSKLPADRPAEEANLIRMEAPTRALIRETQQLHARITRLDGAWRDRFEMRPAAIHRLQERLGRSLARG